MAVPERNKRIPSDLIYALAHVCLWKKIVKKKVKCKSKSAVFASKTCKAIYYAVRTWSKAHWGQWAEDQILNSAFGANSSWTDNCMFRFQFPCISYLPQSSVQSSFEYFYRQRFHNLFGPLCHCLAIFMMKKYSSILEIQIFTFFKKNHIKSCHIS